MSIMSLTRSALLLLLLLFLALTVGCSSDEGESLPGVQSAADGESGPQGFKLLSEPQRLPEVGFTDGEGNLLNFADFEGRVILVNVWATWCPPCRKEMPTLDRLQAELGGPEFEVLALSIDQAGVDVVKEFFAEINVQHLSTYIDETGQAAVTLGAVGVPTTLLLDRQGREIGRLVGEAEWDTPEMVSFLKDVVERTR